MTKLGRVPTTVRMRIRIVLKSSAGLRFCQGLPQRDLAPKGSIEPSIPAFDLLHFLPPGSTTGRAPPPSNDSRIRNVARVVAQRLSKGMGGGRFPGHGVDEAPHFFCVPFVLLEQGFGMALVRMMEVGLSEVFTNRGAAPAEDLQPFFGNARVTATPGTGFLPSSRRPGTPGCGHCFRRCCRPPPRLPPRWAAPH